MHAGQLETLSLTKRFGQFTALDNVSLNVRAGSVHALLGENGAGKSTLVKCIAGYYRADDGSVVLDQREQAITSPIDARRLGIGMVYQHFTVVPGMTVAENLLLARGRLPAVIDWRKERAALESFMATAPFRLNLDATPIDLSAGEKQKLEILKQLLLRPRLLILDEPTSVLTPQEADEVLAALRQRAHAGECTVILITHKFREVIGHADDVSVLERGRLVLSTRVVDTNEAALAKAMVGSREIAGEPLDRQGSRGQLRLRIDNLKVTGDRGEPAVQGLGLAVHSSEIVGVAGVSGNGQRELMQALVGQRPREAGEVFIGDELYLANREQNRRLKVRSLPEEPLLNACVPELSVAANMSLRQFDEAPFSFVGLIRWSNVRARAREWITTYRVKTQGEQASIAALSGGNIQRSVLARELSGDAEVLLVSNPVFGLDFAAVSDIHARLMEARNRGAAVLLVSEDLDELLLMADRIVVMSEGQIVYQTPAAAADRLVLGGYMGGQSQHKTVHPELRATT